MDQQQYELLKSMDAKIDRLNDRQIIMEKRLWIGNGQPSFDQRLTAVETNSEQHDEDIDEIQEDLKVATWRLIAGLLVIVGLVMGMWWSGDVVSHGEAMPRSTRTALK